jgi:hypothetical protein
MAKNGHPKDDSARLKYRAIVLSSNLHKSAIKGTPSVYIKVQTLYDVLTPDKARKLHVAGHLYLTAACMERTLRTLKDVFGFEIPPRHVEELNEPLFNGLEVDVVVEEEETAGGLPEMRVVFFNKPSNIDKPLKGEDLKDLINEVGPLIEQHRSVAQKGADAPLPPPQKTDDRRGPAGGFDGRQPDDADLPF